MKNYIFLFLIIPSFFITIISSSRKSIDLKEQKTNTSSFEFYECKQQDLLFLIDTTYENSLLDMNHIKNIDDEYVTIMDTNFKIVNLDKTKSSIEYHTSKKIDGIVGKDFLKNNTDTIK
jgi:hypothetical protein